MPAGYVEAVDGLEIGPEVGSCGSAAFTGQTQITEDIETDPRWEPFRELALTSRPTLCWSVPLKLPDGDVLGSFRHLLRPIPAGRPPSSSSSVEAYASIVALGLDNLRRKTELAASYEAAVLAFTSALDDTRRLHRLALDRNLAPGARDLRRGSRSTSRETEVAARVAALHDVGKLGIPTEILDQRRPADPRASATSCAITP